MEYERNNLFARLIELLSFKSAIAKKFSIYVILLIAIIIVILVVSIKAQSKVIDENFMQSIKFVTRLIAESIEDPVVGNDMSFLEKFIDNLSSERDVVYVIIFSEDKRVLISSIESYWGKHFSEVGDKFSSLAAHDTRLNLRQENDEEIKRKIQEDIKSVNQRILELQKKNSELRYTGTLKDVDKQKTDSEVKRRILEEEIDHLYDEKFNAEKVNDQNTLKILENKIEEKQNAVESLSNLIISLNSLRELKEMQLKKEKILERIPMDNMIYEVSAPIGGREEKNYGILRIGYSPKKVREDVNKMYLSTFFGGIFFVFIGLAISLHLARTITKPLGELATGAEVLGSGNLYHRINIKTGDEMELLADRFNLMAEKLNESYSSLEQKVQERTREYLDATKELQRAYRKLQKTQAQLIQSEKMTSLGQLVAGVAHELNNPIGFITSNMQPLQAAIENLLKLLDMYNNSNLSEEERNKINKFMEENDFEFLMDDLNDLMEDINEGAKRAHKIVLDLRNFSRLDEAEYKEVDIHQGIDSTLNLLSKYYKHRVEVHKDYGNIPLISCYASQLNQVWMNVLVNAAQAIDGTGNVYIKTYLEDDMVCIKIKDSGKGIEKEVIERIFDPFFTTKPVGEGTGLGLSISHSIIEKHDGTIELDSEVGAGTTFTIKLPIRKGPEYNESSGKTEGPEVDEE